METQPHLEALVQVHAQQVFHDLFLFAQLIEAYGLLQQSMEENYSGEYIASFALHAYHPRAYYLLGLKAYRY